MNAKKQIINAIENCDDEQLRNRMYIRIARRYCAVKRITNVYDEEKEIIITPILPEVNVMVEALDDKKCRKILLSNAFTTYFKGESMKIKVRSIKDMLETKTFEEAETLWDFCWADLRAKEKLIDINNIKEVMQFAYEVKELNKHLLQINKTNPHHMGLTRYWIKRALLEFEVRTIFGLSKGVVMKDNDINFFLNIYSL